MFILSFIINCQCCLTAFQSRTPLGFSSHPLSQNRRLCEEDEPNVQDFVNYVGSSEANLETLNCCSAAPRFLHILMQVFLVSNGNMRNIWGKTLRFLEILQIQLASEIQANPSWWFKPRNPQKCSVNGDWCLSIKGLVQKVNQVAPPSNAPEMNQVSIYRGRE